MSGKSPAQPSRTSSGSGAGGAANVSLQSSAAAPRSPAVSGGAHLLMSVPAGRGNLVRGAK
jgi:hypothetical protein